MTATSSKPKLVLATGNPDKVVELSQILFEYFDVLPRPADLAETVEDGDTLEFNAAKKATEVHNRTQLASLADDSGLFVDALGGAPGVYSARYAGENVTYQDNVDKLLQELSGFSELSQRNATFRTVIVLVGADGSQTEFSGEVKGYISLEQTGNKGFGYDPVFVPHEGDGRSFAEMSLAEKNKISHRARAIAEFLRRLKSKETVPKI